MSDTTDQPVPEPESMPEPEPAPEPALEPSEPWATDDPEAGEAESEGGEGGA
jgi:hypothetical protein